jgi:TonB family protein
MKGVWAMTRTILLLSFFFFVNSYILLAQIVNSITNHIAFPASITQTIGETDFTISYYRIKSDADEKWNNIDTCDYVLFTDKVDAITFSCSKDVLIENEPLKAGCYSLFVIPKENEWIIIFSKGTTFRGLDSENNALIIYQKTVSNLRQDWLAFEFNDFTNSSTKVSMHWDKFSISFHITTGDIFRLMVENSIREQLHASTEELIVGYNNEEINPEQMIEYDNSLNVSYENYFEIIPSELDTPFKEQKESLVMSTINYRDPQPVIMPFPDYPEFQRKAKIEGFVKVKMLITKDGKVSEAEILQTGDIGFDKVALDAAMQWRFIPAVRNNEPIAAWVEVPFYFKPYLK